MNPPENPVAFGAPGIEPRWTSSAKEGLGTAYHTSCRLWFTLSHGIVNEIYYPHVDQPNTRDFQYLISDGETFCHEEKRDLNHQLEYPEREYSNHTKDGRHLYRLNRCILLAHKDKTFEGALVASMSIPWGETKNDNDLGGYHLVWTRDLVQSATAEACIRPEISSAAIFFTWSGWAFAQRMIPLCGIRLKSWTAF